MPGNVCRSRALKIDQLKLDLANPRITQASDQHEAMQRIIDDQDIKLANLAESIVEDGLNPMDRLLVMRDRDGYYIVLEGNRRAAALKILKNPPMLTGLDIRPALQKRLEAAAQNFNPRSIEPIACFEVTDRGAGRHWIEQRHSGEDEGRGIVKWSGLASSRFRGRDPALQALDFVRQHGKLTGDQKKLVEDQFPITTLDRLLSTPDVRSKIGFDVKDDKLVTALPADEAIKPLRRMVLDLAEKKINVTGLKRKSQQIDYVSDFRRADAPDLAKISGTPRPVEAIREREFSRHMAAQPARTTPARQPLRNSLVPRGCKLNVTNAKIGEIYNELRSLRLAQHPHAVAVLLRVFLETSVDHYLTKIGVELTTNTPGGVKDKSLAKKAEEAIGNLVSQGAPKKDFVGVVRGLSVKTHPLSVDLLHAYVHNRFVSPTERDLTAAWDNSQPLFERIWP
jgi:hypothetical protein